MAQAVQKKLRACMSMHTLTSIQQANMCKHAYDCHSHTRSAYEKTKKTMAPHTQKGSKSCGYDNIVATTECIHNNKY